MPSNHPSSPSPTASDPKPSQPPIPLFPNSHRSGPQIIPVPQSHYSPIITNQDLKPSHSPIPLLSHSHRSRPQTIPIPSPTSPDPKPSHSPILLLPQSHGSGPQTIPSSNPTGLDPKPPHSPFPRCALTSAGAAQSLGILWAGPCGSERLLRRLHPKQTPWLKEPVPWGDRGHSGSGTGIELLLGEPGSAYGGWNCSSKMGLQVKRGSR